MKLNLDRFRDVLQFSDRLDRFKGLPDRLADLFEKYDSQTCHPQYREDVYNILIRSIELAEILVDEEHSAPHSITKATSLLGTLSNIINHLDNRPTLKGYSILFPLTRSLHEGVYTTHQEANRKLESLHQLGITQDCKVVPVRITSDLVVRPDPPPRQIAEALTSIERDSADQQLEKELNHVPEPPTAPFGPANGNAGDREDL